MNWRLNSLLLRKWLMSSCTFINLQGLGINVREPFLLMVDNQAAVKTICNPIEDSTTTYLDMHYKCVRERVGNGDISFRRVDTSAQLVDMFTKAFIFSSQAQRIL
jgi:hypothetical protein